MNFSKSKIILVGIRESATIQAMRLGVIGCGKMGTALVSGAVNAGIIKATDISGYDPVAEALTHFTKTTGAYACSSLQEMIQRSDTLLLAVKPQDTAKVCAEISSALKDKDCLIISILAGVKIESLEKALPPQARVIRCMPNTPALVGKGATVFSLGEKCSEEDLRLTKEILSSVGIAFSLPEKHLDAVTGLSGSGPAYAFLIMEALSDAGVKQGLPRHESLQLAAQTLLGAAALVLETNTHPATLKDMVTSPGGTTIAGLAALEENGLRHALISAVHAATKRSIELSKI